MKLPRILNSALALLLTILFLDSHAQAQTVSVKPFASIETALKANKDSFLVVNFWATWCPPCVRELPNFVQAQKDLRAKGVEFLFISFDPAVKAQTTVKPFALQKGMAGEIWVAKEANMNEYIDHISKDWSGAIPATLLVDRQGKYVAFHEGEFDYDTLTKFINDHLVQ